MSGYESLTGQINVGHRNPDTAEPFFLNLFYGSGGRSEFNHVSKHKMGRRWDMVVMSHGEFRKKENDRNQDLFLDMPLQEDFVVRNEWRFVGDRGLRAEFALSGVDMNRDGGIAGEEALRLHRGPPAQKFSAPKSTPRWAMCCPGRQAVRGEASGRRPPIVIGMDLATGITKASKTPFGPTSFASDSWVRKTGNTAQA